MKKELKDALEASWDKDVSLTFMEESLQTLIEKDSILYELQKSLEVPEDLEKRLKVTKDSIKIRIDILTSIIKDDALFLQNIDSRIYRHFRLEEGTLLRKQDTYPPDKLHSMLEFIEQVDWVRPTHIWASAHITNELEHKLGARGIGKLIDSSYYTDHQSLRPNEILFIVLNEELDQVFLGAPKVTLKNDKVSKVSIEVEVPYILEFPYQNIKVFEYEEQQNAN